jgi:hypothetical protein
METGGKDKDREGEGDGEREREAMCVQQHSGRGCSVEQWASTAPTGPAEALQGYRTGWAKRRDVETSMEGNKAGRLLVHSFV